MPGVKLSGDKELVADLRRMSSASGAGHGIKRAVSDVATEMVNGTAARARYPRGRQRPRYPGEQSRSPGALARSVSTRREDFGASLSVGAPYAGAVEFGGWPRPGRRLGPRGGYPYIRAGRYLWPVWSARLAGMEAELDQEIQHMVDSYDWSGPKEAP